MFDDDEDRPRGRRGPMSKKVVAEVEDDRPPRRRYSKAGRPPYVPTKHARHQVEQFVGMGMTREQICKVMSININTLYKYFSNELETADARRNFDVARNLYHMAVDPDHKSSATAAIFWLKSRAGWRDTVRSEITGADGKPIQIESSSRDIVDSRSLSPDQRDALREILQQAMAKQIEAHPKMVDGEYEEVGFDAEFEER